MARRRKALVDLIRDGTFLARKDERLLAAREPLPWPELEQYRQRFLAARADPEAAREVALELQHALAEPDAQPSLLGELQAELLKFGPAGSFEQLDRFAPAFFRHRQGSLASRPYAFPPNHRAFLREFWRRDRHGRRVYRVGLLMEPKGCSKTPTASIVGTHALVSETDAPSVFQIAGSKDQAGFGHEFASWNVLNGKLAAWLALAGGAILCPEHDGEFEILSAEGDFSAGVNPLAAVYDELFLFRHRHQREAWHSQVEALHKREGRSFVLGISTAGYDKATLLGELYDGALEHPQLEDLDDGYHLRLLDTEAGFLFWCHQAPLDADIENPDTWRRATPAPWINPRELMRSLLLPNADEYAVRRLHLNQWTRAKEAWLSALVWDRLAVGREIPPDVEILVGIDAARSFDTTAVSWCWVAPDGRKVIRSHVWSVRQNVPYHEHVPGGELVNEDLVEPFIARLAERNPIRAIAFDPRYFSAEARHLSNAGHTVVEIQSYGGAMGDAVVLFEKDARSGVLEHNGDRILAAHIAAIDAERRPDGSKKIGKRSDAYPIDAGISALLATYLTSLELPPVGGEEPGFAWA